MSTASSTAILSSLTTKVYDAGLLFSGQASVSMIKGFSSHSPFTLKLDGNFIFHEQTRDLIVWILESLDPLYVFGSLGSGKTSCFKQTAAMLNYPSSR
jgi:cobaltochelatase CobS